MKNIEKHLLQMKADLRLPLLGPGFGFWRGGGKAEATDDFVFFFFKENFTGACLRHVYHECMHECISAWMLVCMCAQMHAA